MSNALLIALTRPLEKISAIDSVSNLLTYLTALLRVGSV